MRGPGARSISDAAPAASPRSSRRRSVGPSWAGLDGSVAMLGERPAAGRSALAFATADAVSLPLRDGTFDLALLSMVYHLLSPPDPTVAELRRVLARDGVVIVRTPTRDLLDRVSFLPYFPSARAIDEARMPSRVGLIAVFTGAGFALASETTVEQEFAATPMAAYEKVRRRPFSSLRLISDTAFTQGLARYEQFCRAAPATPLIEPLDLFVFRRA
jgi:SAM-dependent methyltransferase